MTDVADSTVEIFVELLDEGTAVSRPTQARLVGPQEYLVLPTPDYDPEIEHWEFPPGSVVQCALEHLHLGEVLVARKLVRRQ